MGKNKVNKKVGPILIVTIKRQDKKLYFTIYAENTEKDEVCNIVQIGHAKNFKELANYIEESKDWLENIR